MNNEELKYEFNTDEKDQGTRIDTFLSSSITDISRNSVQKLLERGDVTVNGSPCTSKKYKIGANDKISVTIPPPKNLEVKAEDIPIEIMYEDKDVMVVNKPKGMVVHPAAGNYTGTLVNAVMFHCGNRLSSINGVIRPGIVHRIDKDTSGLLMIAKNNVAHEILSKQLSEHSIIRKYQALVHGNIKEEVGSIDAPLGRDSQNRMKRAVTDKNSKRAVTHYKVLERFGKYTLVECQLETGRTHQIRVHMAHIKHPLVGDLLYGPKKSGFNVKGQMLHAKTLGFVHPTTGRYMEFDSFLPEYFEEILNKLRRST